MIINNASVRLAAQHAASSQTEVSETLRAWIGKERPNFEAMERGTTATLSAAALTALQANPPAPLPSTANTASSAGSNEAQAIQDALDQVDSDPMLRLIRLMVEMLTGHKLSALALRLPAAETASTPAVSAAPAAAQAARAQAAPRAGYGIEYDQHVVHSESETTQVQAAGSVHSADGRQIDFHLELSMTRSTREESSVSLRQGDGVKKDPLVINFAADTVNLQSQRFSFTLDGSGSDQLPMLASGSGFLSLDINGNGRIDSGTELFGAHSGAGFADLGKYDSDGNGWIDENDAVFKKLRIWTPDAQGQGSLATLADHNVGALSLAHTATPFELKDGSNRSLGTVRSTGVFLREDGSAGTLQQVDLTV